MNDIAEQPHILVVDDDTRLREALRRYLTQNGFLVATAQDAADARAKLAGLEFDLIVLDVMMPGESGLDLCRDLRRTGTTPVLLLTARGEPEDRIAGLEAGADDYLPKPFEPRELVLRVQSILRRLPRPAGQGTVLTIGRWQFDPVREELRDGEETVRLTSMESGLLRVLAAQPGTVFSREALVEKAAVDAGNDRTIDVQVTRLRRKLEDDPREPRYLLTVRGEGYVLRPD
ncbi:response regulator [Niveispirillum irakense]|uniref:response regulator n=1 Tax=Niveispirillum irakense TaxID=34011 RepID=UPI00040C6111|nr:response regulator transcription factor [Niveispirillum irakense]